jgi:hypothetical protein
LDQLTGWDQYTVILGDDLHDLVRSDLDDGELSQLETERSWYW